VDEALRVHTQLDAIVTRADARHVVDQLHSEEARGSGRIRWRDPSWSRTGAGLPRLNAEGDFADLAWERIYWVLGLEIGETDLHNVICLTGSSARPSHDQRALSRVTSGIGSAPFVLLAHYMLGSFSGDVRRRPP
jgi:hypothetical protein